MNILGISAFYHDSAAALIINDNIIAAIQEERLSRKKNDPQFPENAIYSLLDIGKLKFEDIDFVIFYDKPFLKFERLLETYISLAPKGFQSFRRAIPVWLREKLFLKDYLLKRFKKMDKNFKSSQLMFSEHHFSHAASAFYPSPFDEAIILTLDGVGEWATSSVAIGKKNKIEIKKEIHFPHSIGLLYSAFTYYLGFRVNSGEYKVMGLAPYGEPIYKDLILRHLVRLKEDGSFRLNQNYFNYSTGMTMINSKFCKLFNMPIRVAEREELKKFHMDVAASIQLVIEEIIIRITESLQKEYKINNLCLAGGVALNCVANGKIHKKNIFKNIWVQPASGDAGGALGAALALWYQEFNNERVINTNDSMKGSFLGPNYSESEIERQLKEFKATYTKLSYNDMIKFTAQSLSNGKAVGWFQGRMEFGPRALGSRSILGDPRSKETQKTLNLKVKYRESFRPFAPSILSEHVSKWFEYEKDSPYMTFVANVKNSIRKKLTKEEEKYVGIEKLKAQRSEIPAVTHVDFSSRIQTVHRDTNQIYYDLIDEFNRITGFPILVNTSFNVRGEPIVCTPTDAFKCFMGTELDILVIDKFILKKEEQKVSKLNIYKDSYEID